MAQKLSPEPRGRTIARAICLGLVTVGVVTAVSAARLPFEAAKNQRVLEHAYAETVEAGTPVKPWKRSDVAVAGKLVYPRLRKSLVVVTTGSEEALKAGPSLIPDTAPIGAPGASVISAHRETHFAFLRHARVGDRIQAAGSDGQLRDYRVTTIEVIDVDDLTVPIGQSDSSLVLFTCYPFMSTRLDDRRFVVRAELAD